MQNYDKIISWLRVDSQVIFIKVNNYIFEKINHAAIK